MKHLLGIKQLSDEEIEQIFSTAQQFKEVLNRPRLKKVPSLQGVTIANVFFEPSTRTRISFELAAKRLSADVVNFSASTSSVQKGESLLDTVENLLAMRVDLIILRHPHVGAPHFLARHVKASIINAGDGIHEHPTQALLDAFSLLQKWGNFQNKTVAIIGDIYHSRVARSNILLLKRLGAKVLLCGPPTLIPPPFKTLVDGVYYRIEDIIERADAFNILRIQKERQKEQFFPSLQEYYHYFGVRPEVLQQNPSLIIMHPGPMNRGVEIDSKVADSEQAIILEQVENGVAVRMAVLYLIAGG